MIRFLLVATAMLIGAASAAQAGPKAAIFPVELHDVSIEGELSGPRADETRRLALVTEELRRLAGEAGYEVLDLGGLASDIAQATPLYKCNGCAADLARRVGAEIAVTGVVRKVSTLILQMFISVSDSATGRVTKVAHVDIKGNTNETWLRGIRRLAANALGGAKDR